MKWGIFCLFESFEKDSAKAINSQLNLAKYAESLGFDEVWFAEHHFNDFSVCPSPSLLLAALAAKTEKIRLGAAGFLAPFYDPIRLSEEIAMLDILSDARLNLGFAKGAFAPDCKHFSASTENLRPKLLESVHAIDLLLNSNGAVSFNGEFIKFGEVDIEPKKIQKRIPTFIATFSSSETIEFAAKNGFGLMLSQGISLNECQQAASYYKQIAGVEPEIVLLRTFYVADDKNDAINKARMAIDHFVKSMRAASSFNKSPKFDKRRYEELINERNVFFDGDKFFENGIIGDVQTCINKCERIRDAIKNVHIALKPLGTSEAENMTLLDKFAKEIRIKFR
ncbi:LLM class flavin-dependent oxidoreductase [Campylobacter sp.]|uniref:LLM class flavin-dependent oxidoreductase n=1 Tax=Campylobacter sp. TaxID=205 RepID=UPI0027100CE0|nr:LLM class flavin-dependent oxidoreductase [Campylobacter sp.]